MKIEILTDLAGDTSFFLFDMSLSLLEWPDIDFASIFGEVNFF